MTDCACATMTTPLWTPHSGSESVRSSYSLTSVLSPLSSVRQPPSSSSSSSSAGDAARFVRMSEAVFPPSPPHPQPCPQPQVLRPSPLQQQQQHRKQEEQLQPREEVPMVDDAPQTALECDLPEARARTVAPQQQQQQQRMRRPREEPTADAEAKAREPDETQTRRDSAPRLTREQRALLCREEGHAKAPPPPPPWLVRATRPLWQPLCATLRWVLAQVLGW